jgi:hypothetical protein
MVVANALRSSDGHVVARVINIDAGTTGPVIDLTAASVSELDWVSISALGRYVVAYGTIDRGAQRSKVWDATTGALVGDWQDYTFGHYDLGVDPSGNEVAVGAVGQSPYSHHFIARRLSDGSIIDLTPTGVTSYNWHVSTRATKRPGWAYAATNDRTGYPLDGDVYAIKLDGSKQVERWADHRAENVSYESAPFPVPSPDGRQVLFASNWGNASGPIQTYVAACAP